MLIATMGKTCHGKSTFLKEVQSCMARLRGDFYPGDQRWICFSDPLVECANKIGWQGGEGEKSRRFLQVLGNDLMRECVDEDYWVNLWRPRVEDALRMGMVVFCDDVRFPNEARAVQNLVPSYLIKVHTPEQDHCALDDSSLNHISENALNGYVPDLTITLKLGRDHIRLAAADFVDSLVSRGETRSHLSYI